MRAVLFFVALASAAPGCALVIGDFDAKGGGTSGTGGVGGEAGTTSVSTASTGTVSATSTSTSTGAGAGGAEPCLPGSAMPCTLAAKLGPCAMGLQTCNPSGIGYSSCAPTVKPTFDDCFTPVDEDCDGKTPACTGDSLAVGTFAQPQSQIFAVAADSVGGLVLGGSVNGLGGGTNPTKSDAYIARTDLAGAPLQGWPVTVTSPQNYVLVRGVAVDSSLNVIAVGDYQGNVSFGGAPLPGGIDFNGFVVKLDKDGNHVWSRGFGDVLNQRAYAVTVDPTGNVYVVGEAAGTVEFGCGPLVTTPGGGVDAFAVMYDPKGTCVWSRIFGDKADQRAHAVAAVPGGGIVVVGELAGIMDFGGGPLVSAGARDAFVVRLKSFNGMLVWADQFGDSLDQVAYAVAVDPLGNVGVTGAYKGTIKAGGDQIKAIGIGYDTFVMRLASADGTLDWVKSFGDAADQLGAGVGMDGAGNVVVAAQVKGNFLMGGVQITNADPTGATYDMLAFKLKGATGDVGWARSFGDSQDQRAWALTTDMNGDAFLAGAFQGIVDFGPPAGTIMAMPIQGFVAELAP